MPPKPEKIPAEPAKAIPSEQVKEVGSYVAVGRSVSVLLQRAGDAYPWTILRPEGRVATANTLVSLPGYRSLIALDVGLHLTLWGNLSEFSPSPSGPGKPQLWRSRLVLANTSRNPALQFRASFAGERQIGNREPPRRPGWQQP